MKAAQVTQVALWLGMTEVELFRSAYQWKYDQKGYIEPFIVDFALNDVIPHWVALFIKKCIYPHMIRDGGLVKNPLLPYLQEGK